MDADSLPAVSPDNATTTSSSPPKMAAKRDNDSESAEPVQVGGEIDTSAFALLAGVVYGKVSQERKGHSIFLWVFLVLNP